jgi:DNA polymerase II small subunit
MEKRVLELLTSHGTLVSPEAVTYICEKEDPEEYIKTAMKKLSEAPLFLTIDILKSTEQLSMDAVNIISERSKPPIPNNAPVHSNVNTDVNTIENTMVKEITPETTQKIPMGGLLTRTSIKPSVDPEPKVEILGGTKKPLGSEFAEDLKILKDVTGQSTTEGTLTDFIKHFRERFTKLRKLLQNQRREAMGSIEIAGAKDRQGPLKIIGMIVNARTTKHGHKLIELDDETGSITVLINNSSPLIKMCFIKDEVICVIGKRGKSDLVYAEDVIKPDVPISRRQARSEEPIGCMFLSDIHIGSTTFLHDSWKRFTEWLNGDYSLPKTEVLRDKLKYIVVSGDIVDGIGIYPDQESELDISDIYAQYEDLAEKFSVIPDHMKLIIQPGNHDAVRPAEPQPTFPTEITNLFNGNIVFVGNPCNFKLHNVEILSYHGRSMDDFVMQIPEMSYEKPLAIMKEMLVRRHLAPVYGSKTPIAPEHLDYMVIERVPDIFVTGHIHKTAVEKYRDILMINASAWQSQTSYQKMMNFNPDPAKVIVTNLQTGALQVLHFS